MPRQFKTIALLGRLEDPRVAGPMTALARHLTKAGVDVATGPEVAAALETRPIDEADIASVADLIVAVGGDGTMLHAAGLVSGKDVPLLGINRGRLGFLADVSPAVMLESLERILEGEYTRESRLLVEARISSSTTGDRHALALNDVVLQRRETGRMLDFVTRIDGRYVNAHSGDGLIVATPTGSTAYALSCGGPIIEPQLDALVVVPICPHTLSDRPIVIPANLAIEVNLLPRGDTNAEVTVDGHKLGDLAPDDQLTISQAEHRITLVHPPGYDFYEILRSKLHWGHDSRFRLEIE